MNYSNDDVQNFTAAGQAVAFDLITDLHQI
jgi:hypothetical protein